MEDLYQQQTDEQFEQIEDSYLYEEYIKEQEDAISEADKDTD